MGLRHPVYISAPPKTKKPCFSYIKLHAKQNTCIIQNHVNRDPSTILSNPGTRNLFCYFFLRSDHILTMQTNKNQNQDMAGTKLRTSKVWKCLNFPCLIQRRNQYRRTSRESALYPYALHYYWRFLWLQDSGGHHWGFDKRLETVHTSLIYVRATAVHLADIPTVVLRLFWFGYTCLKLLTACIFKEVVT